MTVSVYWQNAYQAGDGMITHKARKALWDGSDPLVVVCHGRSPTAAAERACLQWAQNDGGGSPHLLKLADRDYALACIDAGGNLTWGNQASSDAVHNAIAWARGNGFAHPTKKALLLGYSMGGAVAANYAHDHPENVAGLLLEAPGADLDYFYANGYASELDTAYGGNYTLNGKARSPMSFAPSLAMPALIYTAINDSVVPNSIPHSFYNALPVGAKLIRDLPGGDHTDFWQYISQDQINDWVDTLPW